MGLRKLSLFAALWAIGGAMTAAAARADYIGQTIEGTLAFGPFDIGFGQFWNTPSVRVPGTFFYSDAGNTDTVEFTGTTMIITDQVISTSSGWGMTFADAAMPFAELSLVSSGFGPGSFFNLTDSVIVAGWIGTATPGTYTAVFEIAPDPTVPEPSSLALVGTALAGLGLMRYRQKRP